MSISSSITSHFVTVQGLQIHYLSIGTGTPILLLHGWPTSSYLWRNIMVPLSQTRQVIAMDLPGFGQSSKSLEGSYSFNYYDRMIDGFVNQLGISKTGLVVHDLGGPVGLMWAVRHPEKVDRLTLLNTLVYPEFSWAVRLFLLATFVPGIKDWLVSTSGLVKAMQIGVKNQKNLTKEVLRNYYSPFQTAENRKVLLKTAQRLSPKGFQEIAEKLPQFKIPIRLIYGENDKILPDVANTMRRLKQDIPQAQLTALPQCGHFLQEDAPEQLSQLLLEFFTDQ